MYTYSYIHLDNYIYNNPNIYTRTNNNNINLLKTFFLFSSLVFSSLLLFSSLLSSSLHFSSFSVQFDSIYCQAVTEKNTFKVLEKIISTYFNLRIRIIDYPFNSDSYFILYYNFVYYHNEVIIIFCISYKNMNCYVINDIVDMI